MAIRKSKINIDTEERSDFDNMMNDVENEVEKLQAEDGKEGFHGLERQAHLQANTEQDPDQGEGIYSRGRKEASEHPHCSSSRSGNCHQQVPGFSHQHGQLQVAGMSFRRFSVCCPPAPRLQGFRLQACYRHEGLYR